MLLFKRNCYFKRYGNCLSIFFPPLMPWFTLHQLSGTYCSSWTQCSFSIFTIFSEAASATVKGEFLPSSFLSPLLRSVWGFFFLFFFLFSILFLLTFFYFFFPSFFFLLFIFVFILAISWVKFCGLTYLNEVRPFHQPDCNPYRMLQATVHMYLFPSFSLPDS